MALRKYSRSKMVRPREKDPINIYDDKTDDPILYFDLFNYIKRCAEQWHRSKICDPVCIIDREYNKELKK